MRVLGGWLAGQFSAEEEVRGESHMAPSLLQGVWTSCRAAPCQELSGDGWKKGRKRGKGRNTDKRMQERWSVLLPEEEAWMTQTTSLYNQKGRERQRLRGRRK